MSGGSLTARLAGWILAAGGVLLCVGGNLHPHDDGADYAQSTAARLANSAWAPAHWVILLGVFSSSGPCGCCWMPAGGTDRQSSRRALASRFSRAFSWWCSGRSNWPCPAPVRRSRQTARRRWSR